MQAAVVPGGRVFAQRVWLDPIRMAGDGKFSGEMTSPAGHHLGLWVIAVPIAGSLIVGVMARYGSKAIRGHAFLGDSVGD